MAELDPTAILLGEIKAQLRELVHSTNTVSQGQIAIERRLAILETENAAAKARMGVASAIFKSPAIGWAVGVLVSAWAIISGKVHP